MGFNFVRTGSSFISVLSSSTINNQEPFTIAAWIAMTNSGVGNLGTIVSKMIGVNSGYWRFLLSGRAIRFIKDYSTTDLDAESAPIVDTSGTYQHVAMTWNGGAAASGISFYHNASSISIAAGTTNGVGTKQSDALRNIYIGGRGSGLNQFDGKISEVYFFGSSVLAQREIEQLATSRVKGIGMQIVPSTGGLRFYFPGDEFPDGATLTGANVIRDESINGNHGTPGNAANGSLPTSVAEEVLTYP